MIQFIDQDKKLQANQQIFHLSVFILLVFQNMIKPFQSMKTWNTQKRVLTTSNSNPTCPFDGKNWTLKLYKQQTSIGFFALLSVKMCR